MRVISLKPLRQFWARHPGAETTLRLWYRTVLKAQWKSIGDVRRTYASADGLVVPGAGVLTVFNIGGNKYRLVVRIRYDYQLVNVRAVLTHAECDKGKWKEGSRG